MITYASAVIGGVILSLGYIIFDPSKLRKGYGLMKFYCYVFGRQTALELIPFVV